MTRTTSPHYRVSTTRMPKLPITVLPGILGGVETQMAFADGVVYAPIVNIPVLFKTQEDPTLEIPKGTGEMVALNVGDGSVKWKRDLAQPAYGAATISNDLVFTTTFEGKVIALDRDTGSVVWEKQLPAGTNATVAIVGDTLITAASFPQSKGQQPRDHRLSARRDRQRDDHERGDDNRRRRGRRQADLHLELRELPHAGRSRHQRLGRAEPRPAEAQRGHGRAAGAKRRRRHALLRGPPEQCSRSQPWRSYVAQNAGKVSSSGGGGGP